MDKLTDEWSDGRTNERSNEETDQRTIWRTNDFPSKKTYKEELSTQFLKLVPLVWIFNSTSDPAKKSFFFFTAANPCSSADCTESEICMNKYGENGGYQCLDGEFSSWLSEKNSSWTKLKMSEWTNNISEVKLRKAFLVYFGLQIWG